jgi:hypothetical protein
MDVFTINREARRLAEKLLAQARENEPTITADLRAVAQQVSAEMVGLENKFKAEEALIRKLIDAAGGDIQKLWRKSKTVNDVLRYTFVWPPDLYAEGFRRTLEYLRQLGYRIPEHRIWNAWENIGTAFDKGYRGINVTVVYSQNRKFELQFHTKASFELKTETHHFYEEMRDKNISGERETELTAIMLKMAAGVERPDGV